jgi:group I intron endonuclease
MENIYTIYRALNKINGKSYVGFTSTNPDKRKWTHEYNAIKLGYPQYFYNALRKYGKESFDWTILYQSKDREHTLKKMEQFFIDEYQCEYNMTPGGGGFLHTKESKNKLSLALKGRQFSEETKKRMSDSAKKKRLSEEHKRKIKESCIRTFHGLCIDNFATLV